MIVAQREWDEVMHPGETTETPASPPLTQAVKVVADIMNTAPFNTPPEKLAYAQQAVLADKVQPRGENVFTVQGSKLYNVNGECSCPQGQHGRSKWCKHLVAVELYRRVQQRLTPWPEKAKAQPAMTPHTPTGPQMGPQIPHEWLVELHGKQFIKFEGLLQMAHARGLESLTVSIVQVSESLAICEATCELDGKHFTDIGDATPANVNKQVAKHFIRCAATRAKARVLRSALGIGMTAVEELED